MPKSMQRLGANLYFENVRLAGVDQALHGTVACRAGVARRSLIRCCWCHVDSTPGTRAFRYDVNPRFAETRPSRTTLRVPFRVTLDFSLRLSTDFALQELRRALEPVRVNRVWQPRSADSLTALYLTETSNIHTAILAESDSLFLTPEQVTALRTAEAAYAVRVRQVYGELGQFLAQFAGQPATKVALDSAAAAKKAYWRVFWEQPEIAGGILSPTQRDLMNVLKDMLSIPKARREGSQWYFGSPVKFVKLPAATVTP